MIMHKSTRTVQFLVYYNSLLNTYLQDLLVFRNPLVALMIRHYLVAINTQRKPAILLKRCTSMPVTGMPRVVSKMCVDIGSEINYFYVY